MPYGDGTGPSGQGSRTGKGRGSCSGKNSPGNTVDVRRNVGKGIADRARNLFRRVRGDNSGRTRGIPGRGSGKGGL